MAYDPSKWYSYSNLYEQKKDSEKPFVDKDDKYDNGTKNDLNSLTNFYDRPIQSTTSTSDNIYVKSINNANSNSNEYDPCSPAISKQGEIHDSNNFQKPDPRKLDRYITSLQRFIRPLSLDYKKKLPYDVICQLAHSILDGTVFEITKGLQDIQKISEKNLSERRNKLLHKHRQTKLEITKRHQKEIVNSQSRPHQILVLEKQHNKEAKNFQEQCEKEVTTVDQKIILELDQLMSDQQATLQRAGLPLFYITNNPDDIQLQMYVLEFILKLTNS